jgi:hypothetical protein
MTYERHHVIPRCMGGPDEEWNIALLTHEEHIEAHHILYLMNPTHKGLAYAFHAMSGQKMTPSDRGRLGAQTLVDRGIANIKVTREQCQKGAYAVQQKRSDPEYDREWRAKRASPGEKHGMYKPDVINLVHKDGAQFTGTRMEFKRLHGNFGSNFGKMLNGRRPMCQGWKLYK